LLEIVLLLPLEKIELARNILSLRAENWAKNIKKQEPGFETGFKTAARQV